MNKDYEHTLGLKVANANLSAKALYAIKRMTGFSLSSIKDKISRNDYLMLTEPGEIEELHCINELKRELTRLNVEVKLFQDDEEESSEYFDNIEKRSIEIAEETDY